MNTFGSPFTRHIPIASWQCWIILRATRETWGKTNLRPTTNASTSPSITASNKPSHKEPTLVCFNKLQLYLFYGCVQINHKLLNNCPPWRTVFPCSSRDCNLNAKNCFIRTPSRRWLPPETSRIPLLHPWLSYERNIEYCNGIYEGCVSSILCKYPFILWITISWFPPVAISSPPVAASSFAASLLYCRLHLLCNILTWKFWVGFWRILSRVIKEYFSIMIDRRQQHCRPSSVKASIPLLSFGPVTVDWFRTSWFILNIYRWAYFVYIPSSRSNELIVWELLPLTEEV